VEKQRDQGDGQRQNDDGADVRTHRVLSAFYYTAQHVVVVSAHHTL
jgi:hypothetical protein